MCRMTVAVCAVPLLTFGGTAAAGAATVTSASHASVVQQTTPGEILNLVNAERAKAGCAALQVNPLLQQIAQAHADDEERNNFDSHTGSDGSTVPMRMTSVGYNYRALGGTSPDRATGARRPMCRAGSTVPRTRRTC
ncbi:CAP domain-containing protein [Streptomyces sp. NPDC002265]|uniref:CAP domain-containing protein n=1 Tax=Streptomyces sp. NPDC002265 TaxID=3154415 RepID=UPI0033168032